MLSIRGILIIVYSKNRRSTEKLALTTVTMSSRTLLLVCRRLQDGIGTVLKSPALQQSVKRSYLLKQSATRALCTSQVRSLNKRGSSTAAAQASLQQSNEILEISEAMPTSSHSLKIMFNDHQACEFKHVWLRDNCRCPKCVHPESRQKLVDTALLDMNLRPKSVIINAKGQLEVSWPEKETHESLYDAEWLYKHGKNFASDSFESWMDKASMPPMEFWDRVSIWKSMPEISYKEVMQTEEGLKTWLEMMWKYGMAIMRNVPCEKGEIINVVNRFAYVKSTIWGQTFDVVCEPVQSDPSHLAYTGTYLELHTDMNYREKSPGLQLLHCLKANDPQTSGVDYGGKSFFVDGFAVAEWLRENHPAAFHILSSTPVKFSIKSHAMTYSQTIPVICVDKENEIEEIHYNNRTLSPLQIPSHLVMPFYHAYSLFAMKMREQSQQLSFHLVPGDLVAFNNRRVLHGRTSFDPTKVSRHLQGAYVDIDEVFTRFNSMLN